MPGLGYYPEEATTAFAYESLSVTSGAAVGCTSATYAPASGAPPASRAYVTVENAQIRFRTDGTAPTTTEGHIVNPGTALELLGIGNIIGFKAIATSATATLKVTYER